MRWKLFSLLLACSGVTIIFGALVLRFGNLVPTYLTYLTFIAAAAVFIDSFFVLRRSKFALLTGVLLGVIAIAVSSNPAHFTALLQFGSSLAVSLADITMVLGFYLFPGIYITLYIMSVIGRRKKAAK